MPFDNIKSMKKSQTRLSEFLASLELFARKAKKGWDVWGNEKDKFNNGYFSTRDRPSNMSKKKKLSS